MIDGVLYADEEAEGAERYETGVRRAVRSRLAAGGILVELLEEGGEELRGDETEEQLRELVGARLGLEPGSKG